jgi:hypothetical protein
MSFTAHWKPTTGFNVEDYPVVIGKQLNQCTPEELLAHPMCGSVSLFANISYIMKHSDLGYSEVAMHLTGGAQWKEPIVGSQSATWVCEPAQTGDDAKIYRRSIFIAWKSTVTIPQYSIDDTCDNDIYIVDDIKDPNKLVYNTTGQSDLGTGDGAAITARVGAISLSHTCQKHQNNYASAPHQVVYEDPDTHVVTQYNIGLVYAYVVGTEVFLCCKDHLGVFGGRYQNANNQYNFLSGGDNYKSFKSANNYRLFLGQNVNGLGREATLGEIWPDCYPDPIPNPATFSNGNVYYAVPNTILPYQIEFHYSMQNSTISGYLASRSLFVGLSDTTATEARRQQIARAGVYFVFDGLLLKPIIEDGIVVNYGTPEDESEIDDYTDLNHPVPTTPGGGPTPPTPPGPSGDEWDNMPISGSTIGALAGLSAYVCSRTDITNLKSWMSKTQADGGPPDGYDVMQNIIGLMAFPIDMTRASSDAERVITFNGLSTAIDNSLMNIMTALFSIANAVSGTTPAVQVRTFTSPVSALPCRGNPFDISLGTITCPVFYPDSYPFADYDASVEVYIPFVGCLPLDTQSVSGRELKATLTVDPVTGSVYGQCECYKADDNAWVTVAAGSGAMGVTIPVSANQVGLAMAQVKNAAGATRDAAITSALSIVTGSPAMPSAVGASLANNRAIRQLTQSNHNSIAGSSGGTTADWSCYYGAYLKITAPNIHDAGENYKHTYGVPTVSSGTLSSFTGFTICVNPDVSGISATDEEKNKIYSFLTGGVYV